MTVRRRSGGGWETDDGYVIERKRDGSWTMTPPEGEGLDRLPTKRDALAAIERARKQLENARRERMEQRPRPCPEVRWRTTESGDIEITVTLPRAV